MSQTPTSQEENLLDHEYDGIREFDNPTPAWWHFIFLGTIIYSVVYLGYYHISVFSTSVAEAWDQRQVEENRRIFGTMGELEPDEATIVRMMNDDRMLGVARGMFIANCAACHAQNGGGISGVNLTDHHWKSVRKLPDIFDVISKGAAVGAMPPWEQRLSQNERIILTAYVANLRSDTPAPGREPEGEVIPPWPRAAGPE